jgi:hypothetical protein
MSVEHKTYLGLGWLITQEEYQKMREIAADRWDEIEDEFMPVNMYSSNSDVFLGKTFGSFHEGTSTNITKLIDAMWSKTDADEFCTKYVSILNMCGQKITAESKWAEAQVYVLSVLF